MLDSRVGDVLFDCSNLFKPEVRNFRAVIDRF
ncbi:MAG: hypothetical protein JWM80_527, partial [Cyanobacteria bacterium RYN_339]|nr:hypothetical protein [Cyanobacteria bacterium RYN_339]